MTSPVIQEPKSEKISMTAPVVQIPAGESWTMTFMMPSKYNLESLPQPTDPKVILEEVPEKTIAVIRYSGLWSEKKNNKKAALLKEWLSKKGIYSQISEPMFAGYNPPWTLWFLRRNEMLIEINQKN
jgi:hypothetical protein